MNVSWEKIEKNRGVLTVEVESERFLQALDKAFKKVAPKVVVPGFRKGKVPRAIFEKRFGVESLYQDAIDILLPEAYMEAVKEADITPVDQPEINIEQIGKGEPFKFTATVDVKPEVELGEYKGIEVQDQEVKVTAEDVEEELKRMQERHAELVVLEEGEAAQEGDTAVIDFEGFKDGEAFEGGKGENYSLVLGSNTFIPGFEDQVIGMKKGEEKEIHVTFPEDYHSEELAGQPVVFKVKVNDIKRKVLPELDDEFAKDVSEFETLEELKKDIEETLRKRREEEKQRYVENTVVEKAAEAAQVDIPQGMIRTEIDNMLRDFELRIRQQGLTLDLYYQFTGQNEDALREQMRPDAEKRVRNFLVLEAIAKAENLTVSDEEFEEELKKLAELYQRPVDELRDIFTANGYLEELRTDLLTRKSVQFLVDNSKLVNEVA
ncbi:trigger factor [Insulibacter thermoxylanivorax]|uniref:Trigger factor n=1 Tax=Insulibacter thermoxylanivorax TaxID=2749268 RepID=A0A916QG70_9BACL|nr:trigger factor [Insulibacter thermoxylanivorax]GFR39074.1 trigger factor [Insulibacter thermoxylanivorax]